ncbi:DUF7940 domain-containing protein [Desulfobulbus oligotrophicus]|uniref:Holin n=1 Tax=Desulfobulbus oligotrophicus TaxID=1909699 RepID=A0A7T5VEF1_9BACT|nr:hypothetical protein [Desulfobulbus oligotrophicus]QQG66373.1 hypothetical protein HP555_11085 [Desulfobulbus oligotrophicus]
MNLKLIPEWKDGLKMYSVQVQAVIGSLCAIYLAIPEKLQDKIEMWWLLVLFMVLVVVGIVGRLIDQGITVHHKGRSDDAPADR